MAVLDSTQFNQLVQEVRDALLAGSQGVGEVEVVTSLANLVSLPALRLSGRQESVVEAPLELLSAPAVEAAADARKATDDAVVAAVNASAAADLSEAERKDLSDIKEQAVASGTGAAARGDKAFAGAMSSEDAALYALHVASCLQTKLEQAQVVILSGGANRDVIESLDRQVKDSILICAGTREEAYAAVLRLRELQMQVAQAVVDAYASFDRMRLSIADAVQATLLADKASERLHELSERTERVIIESVVQTGEAGRAVVVLSDLERDLLFSRSAADTAAGVASVQAARAEQMNAESERLNADSLLLHDRLAGLVPELEEAAGDAVFSAAGADVAAGHATEQAEAARLAAERSNTLSDNPPKILDGVWWAYSEKERDYVSTGLQAKGDTGSSFRVLGNYVTLDELKASVPDGFGIDGVYGVGVEPPYTYYAWTFLDGVWGWHSQGQLQGQRGESAYEAAVRLSGYAGTEEEYAAAPVRNAALAGAAAEEASAAAMRADHAGSSAIGSSASADLAAENARTQSAAARRAAALAGDAAEECLLVTGEAREAAAAASQAAGDAVFSAAGADVAAGHATEQAEAARLAAERSNTLSDNPPKILDGTWWIYSEKERDYVDTGISSQDGGGMLFADGDPVDVQSGTVTNAGAGWNRFTFPRAFSGIPCVTFTPVNDFFIIAVKEVDATGFFYQLGDVSEVSVVSEGFFSTTPQGYDFNYIAILKE